MTTKTDATTLDELLSIVKRGGLSDDEMTNLPTFGGEELYGSCLDGRAAIWSWDESRVMIGTGSDDMRIVSRDEIASE